MDRRQQHLFLLLVLAQASHSVEEYVAKLYEVFAPTQFVVRPVSDDLARGFLIINIWLVTIGLLCWALPVGRGWRAAGPIMWFWIVVELANGLAHVTIALDRGAYFPGIITAPLLVFLAGWLAVRRIKDADHSVSTPSRAVA